MSIELADLEGNVSLMYYIVQEYKKNNLMMETMIFEILCCPIDVSGIHLEMCDESENERGHYRKEQLFHESILVNFYY